MSVRRRLQRETAELHALLDARALERGWFDDLARYGAWLRGMHAFHGRIEDDLSGIELPGLYDAGRLERLKQDMTDLSVAPLSRRSEISRLVTDRQTALGVLYVTEGATLGSRVLFKRAQALGCSAGHGARFLAAEAKGFETWHAVLAALDSVALDESECSRLASASVLTFKLAVECLDDVHAD